MNTGEIFSTDLNILLSDDFDPDNNKNLKSDAKCLPSSHPQINGI